MIVFFWEQPWFLGFVSLTWIPPCQNIHNFKIVNLIINVILVIDPMRRNIKTTYTLIMQSDVHNTSKQKHSILTSHKHKYMHTHPTTHIHKVHMLCAIRSMPNTIKMNEITQIKTCILQTFFSCFRIYSPTTWIQVQSKNIIQTCIWHQHVLVLLAHVFEF